MKYVLYLTFTYFQTGYRKFGIILENELSQKMKMLLLSEKIEGYFLTFWKSVKPNHMIIFLEVIFDPFVLKTPPLRSR